MHAFRVDLAALTSNLKSGAAFGATLYRDLVLFCATRALAFDEIVKDLLGSSVFQRRD
jgi:hypothetical protein